MITDAMRMGLFGELRSSIYLREKGYRILNANYKTKFGEIDIIAEDEEYICIIEVKTRRAGGWFSPADAVNKAKEERVKSAAAHFATAAKIKKQLRFDIIEVITDDFIDYEMNHIINAF